MPFPDEVFAQRVEVEPYREGWGEEGAAYVGLLRELMPGAVAIDHIGSTSVAVKDGFSSRRSTSRDRS